MIFFKIKGRRTPKVIQRSLGLPPQFKKKEAFAWVSTNLMTTTKSHESLTLYPAELWGHGHLHLGFEGWSIREVWQKILTVSARLPIGICSVEQWR